MPNDVADRDELDYLRATRDSTSQLAAGDTTAADPYSAFIEAIIATLSISPCSPETSGRAYLQSARQRARRVLLACRRAVEGPVAAAVDRMVRAKRLRHGVAILDALSATAGVTVIRSSPLVTARSSSRGIAALAHQCARGRKGFLAGEGWAGGRART